MNVKRTAISEAIGWAAIYCGAVYLHFCCALDGGTALSILFGAVNESVWEHVKIFSAAYVGWSLLQLGWLRVPFRRYAVAKCLGLYALMGGLMGLHYLIEALTTGHLLWADIGSSAALLLAVQWLTVRLYSRESRLEDYFAPAMMLLLLYYLMFFSFTIFPPRMELFRDPRSGKYGI